MPRAARGRGTGRHGLPAPGGLGRLRTLGHPDGLVQRLVLGNLVGGVRAPPAQDLRAGQNAAVDGKEDGRGQRLGEQDPERVLQHQPGDPHRDRGDDQQPGQLLVGGFQPAMDDAGEEAADDPHPGLEVIADQDQGRGQVQADDERQVRAFRVAFLPDQGGPGTAHPGRDQHGVAEAGDREQFGEPLDEPDDHGLQDRSFGRCRACSRPPGDGDPPGGLGKITTTGVVVLQ